MGNQRFWNTGVFLELWKQQWNMWQIKYQRKENVINAFKSYNLKISADQESPCWIGFFSSLYLECLLATIRMLEFFSVQQNSVFMPSANQGNNSLTKCASISLQILPWTRQNERQWKGEDSDSQNCFGLVFLCGSVLLNSLFCWHFNLSFV